MNKEFFTQIYKINKQHISVRIIYGNPFGGIIQDVEFIKNILKYISAENKIKINIQKVLFKKNAKTYDKVDIQFFIEHVFIRNVNDMFPSDNSYLFVNQEFINRMDYEILKNNIVKPLCKTYYCKKILYHMGITNSRYICFGNILPIPKPTSKINNCFIHIAGKSPLKGTLLVLEAWLKYINNITLNPFLIITLNSVRVDHSNTHIYKYFQTLNPIESNLPDVVLANCPNNIRLPKFDKVGNIYLYNGELDYEIIKFLHNITMAELCPSAIEGWGQYIDEARRASNIILSLDAAPMNELLIDKNNNHCGVLIPAIDGPSMTELVPYSWYMNAPLEISKIQLNTYTAYLHDMANGIIKILNMTEDEKKSLRILVVQKSMDDAITFKENMKALLINLNLL
jgi:hypothetical protein